MPSRLSGRCRCRWADRVQRHRPRSRPPGLGPGVCPARRQQDRYPAHGPGFQAWGPPSGREPAHRNDPAKGGGPAGIEIQSPAQANEIMSWAFNGDWMPAGMENATAGGSTKRSKVEPVPAGRCSVAMASPEAGTLRRPRRLVPSHGDLPRRSSGGAEVSHTVEGRPQGRPQERA